MKRIFVVVAAMFVLAAGSTTAADVRLGAEMPLGPAPQFAAGAQIDVQVAYGAGHTLAVWLNDNRTAMSGAFDGAPIALPSNSNGLKIVGVAAGRRNFLIAFEQMSADLLTTPVVGLRVGFDGGVLDAAPLVLVQDTHGFWDGGVASDGSGYTVAVSKKPQGLPSVILPYQVATGGVSEDGVTRPGALFQFAQQSSRAASPRIAWSGEHFVIGYAVQTFTSDQDVNPPPWGISAMPYSPDASGSATLGATTFPALDPGGITSSMAVGADRVTFAWVAVDSATKIKVAQTDVAGRALTPATTVATTTPLSVSAQGEVAIAWDGSEYLVAWVAAPNPPNLGRVRGLRLRYDGTSIDAAPFDISTSDSAARHVSIAATSSGFVIAYSRADDSSGGAQRAFARTLQRIPQPSRRRAALR